MHPEYNEHSKLKFNDIAIIRLKQKVSFTHFVMPICLPSKNEQIKFEAGQMFSVSGWGRTDLCKKFCILVLKSTYFMYYVFPSQ